MRKVRFFTLGCKVNQYETQALREKFLKAGLKENNNGMADIYVINTCTVTAQADRESRRLIRKAIRDNPGSKIFVTGCLVEKDTQQILEISDRIRIMPNQQKDRLKISDFKDHERAFAKVQDGCNNCCAYCKVPLVRGKSRSRNLKEIIAEVKRLVSHGFKEIVLTGICLGDYRYGNLELTDVLASLEKIEGKFRIRLSSIEPQLIRKKLIEKIADSKEVCPHLHIPLQSGDNVILKRMNRKYTVKNYLSLIAKVKKKIKDVAITTDVLVGFPGENEKNFRNTVRCLKEVSPLRTHIFPFSPRQGTAAFNLKGRIEPQIVKDRVNLLKETAKECSYKFRKRFLGRQLSVLVESRRDKQNDFFCGYSENYIRVIAQDTDKRDVNRLLPVKVEQVDMHVTKGTVLRLG